MYDARWTRDFDGTLKLKRSCRRIYTEEGNLVGGLTSRRIYDLNGNVLGNAEKKEKRKDESGGTERTVLYQYKGKDPYGRDKAEYRLVGNQVYRNGEYVGEAEKKRNGFPIVLISVTAAVIALVLALVLLETPRTVPEISVRDDNGYWGKGKIAVLDETVYPGNSGAYTFVIENPNEADLRYSFRIYAEYNGEILNGEELEEFPLVFRLKTDDGYIGLSDWLTAEETEFGGLEIASKEVQSFALEWRWSFEGGNDGLDTRYGTENGELALMLTLIGEEA